MQGATPNYTQLGCNVAVGDGLEQATGHADEGPSMDDEPVPSGEPTCAWLCQYKQQHKERDSSVPLADLAAWPSSRWSFRFQPLYAEQHTNRAEEST